MDIWCYIERGDDGYYPSTHLTEKGCLVESLENICSVLDFDCQEGYEAFRKSMLTTCLAEHSKTPKQNIFPIDQTRTKEELWKIYDYLSEYTWDLDGFDCEIVRTRVRG